MPRWPEKRIKNDRDLKLLARTEPVRAFLFLDGVRYVVGLRCCATVTFQSTLANLKEGEVEFAAGWRVWQASGNQLANALELRCTRQPAASSASRFLDSRRLKLTPVAGLILHLESPLNVSGDSIWLVQTDLFTILHS
jgi:hypothetical protein